MVDSFKDWFDEPVARAGIVSGNEGTVFLDSALSDSRAFSLLATNPERWIEGKLPDVSTLENALEEGRKLDLFEGGLAGAFSYDGRYRFGFYPQWEVFRNSKQSISLPREQGECVPTMEELVKLNLRPGIKKREYLDMVEKARSYIAAGDIYQACLAYPVVGDFSGDPWKLYLEMRAISPAPYSAFLHLGETRLLSSSPELFLHLEDREITTSPIKGTRARSPKSGCPDEEAAVEKELLSSPKERAELVMITDLERNDLGRVCEFGSVEVTELLRLTRFARVVHLISTVRGILRPEVSHPAALAACFPGGSITGAPKKRAMEIISELEPYDRGYYTGAIGCFGFAGKSVLNIAIRTMEIQGGKARYGVGAGIVADSNPAAEWNETLVKAGGLIRVRPAESRQ